MQVFHPSHRPWKSLRDSHIPTASTTAYIWTEKVRRKQPRQINQQLRVGQIKLPKWAKCSCQTHALRFLYHVTLKQDRVIEMIPFPKPECQLPVIVSPEEILRLLEAAPSFSHQVIFSTMYGTGLRVSEALHLRVPDLDSQRMMIRIEQGKGHRDRYVPLSPKLLELLRTYWRKASTAALAVPRTVSQPTSEPRGRRRCHSSSQRACWLEETVSPHSLRHAYAVHLLEAGTDIRKIHCCWVIAVYPPRPAISVWPPPRSAPPPAPWICFRCPSLIQNPRPPLHAAGVGSRRYRARARRPVSPGACCFSVSAAEAGAALDRTLSHRGARRSSGTM